MLHFSTSRQSTQKPLGLKMLPDKMKFRDVLTVTTSSPTKMQLRSGESEVILIRGNAVAELIPALLLELDGSRPWSEVVHKLEHIASPEVIQACIEQLLEQGVLAEVTAESEHVSEDDIPLFRFFSHPPFVPEQILAKVQNASIGTFCEDRLEGKLIRSLRRHSFKQFRSLSYDLSKLHAEIEGLTL